MAPLKENINLAMSYQESDINAANSRELEYRLRELAGPAHLVYARPGYTDGHYG
jgi:hypothetical protein